MIHRRLLGRWEPVALTAARYIKVVQTGNNGSWWSIAEFNAYAPSGHSTDFTWPDVPAGQPDVINAQDQVVSMSGSGTTLSLLGAASNGTQSEPFTVTYTDGTTSTSTVTFADWYTNQAVPGCTLVFTSPYLNLPSGSSLSNNAVSTYAASIPLTAGKQVAFLTLPDNERLHVFAATIS